MKLTFKVCMAGVHLVRPSMLINLSYQDLKQQKFVIEAEPSETVRCYFCYQF